MAEIINDEKFTQYVLNSSKPVLIDFFATWCGPCKMLAPIIDEIASENVFDVYKVDVDASPELAERYSITSIPTLIVFKDGEPVKTSLGYKNKKAIIDMLAEK